MYIEGDDYMSDRMDGHLRDTRVQQRVQRWGYLITGLIGGTYMVFGERWLLVMLLLAIGIMILHAVELAQNHNLFVMAAIEHRARLIEGRTEGISSMVERIDRGQRGSE
jgi:hypothetical protein